MQCILAQPRRRWVLLALIGVFGQLGLSARPGLAQAKPEFSRTEDVIYGRKFGMALTMDVFRPEKPNGHGIIFVVCGGWFSAHAAIKPDFYKTYFDRGYTVFAVVPGSQPK